MKTDLRWASAFNEYFPLLLTRPWAMEKQYGKYYQDEFERDLVGFEQWSLWGIEDFQNYHRLIQLIESAKKELAHFYISKYSWQEEKSRNVADKAINFLFDISFRFGGSIFITGEADLRRAILSGGDLEEIQAVKVDFSAYNKRLSENHWARENLLTIAVNNPPAVKYLIEKGLEVNDENGFGKTPLMYAAQFDSLQSVKYLVEAGADVNAETFIPWDTCNYDLHTSGYTPLHYAARYASKDVIEFLIGAGASTYKQTTSFLGEGNEKYPVDWLAENPKLSDHEIVALQVSMSVPVAGAESMAMSKGLNRQAEKDYADGNAQLAYQKLNMAIQLDANNHKALSNLSLVGIKVSQHRRALESALAIIKSDASNKNKASAYFNAALSIQDYLRENKVKRLHSLEITEGQYDRGHVFEGFLQSYVLAPRSDRANKIVEYLREIENLSCPNLPKTLINVSNGSYSKTLAGKRGESLRTVSVLHDNDVGPNEICWTNDYVGGSKRHCAKVEKSFALGEHTLSLFKATDMYLPNPPNGSKHITIGGKECGAAGKS